MAEVNAGVIEQFRAGGPVEGMNRDRLLLLTTTGRRTGSERTTPMMFHRDADRLLVIASNAGAPRDPDWYRNLVADPAVTVEIGDRRHRAHAVTVEGADREALWAGLVASYPFFADHATAAGEAGRTIPLVELRETV